MYGNRFARGRRALAFLLGITLAIPVLAACGSRAADRAGEQTVTASDVWIRAVPDGGDVTAVYMTLTNEGTKRATVVSMSVPNDVAESTQLHESSPAGSTESGGMKEINTIDIPANDTVKLEPGGTHVMLIGVKKPLEAGSRIPVTVDFTGGGGFTIDAEVRQS